jgi:hypothetical protein
LPTNFSGSLDRSRNHNALPVENRNGMVVRECHVLDNFHEPLHRNSDG